MDRRVLVTGAGVVTPCGMSVESFWDSIKKGKSGIKRISRFDPSNYRCQIAGEITDFDPYQHFEATKIGYTDRALQFALIAEHQAKEDSGLSFDLEDKSRIGICVGQTVGGVDTGERYLKEYYNNGNSFSEKNLYKTTPSIGASILALEFGIHGANIILSTGCAAGTDAIGYAFNLIRKGRLDIVITGGFEAPIAPLALASFDVIHALSSSFNKEPQKASRPFDKNRDGFVASEGSVILILEEYEHALKRNALIYGEIIGYGTTSNAYHMTAPEPSGESLAKAMIMAIDDAKIDRFDIHYYNAHGSSTPLNDKEETNALKHAFGDYAYNLPISSTKSITGHMLGAAGAAELLVTLLSVRDDILPPTINYEYYDPACDLDYIPNYYRRKKLDIGMSASAGFGGINCCIIVKKYDKNKEKIS